MSTQIKQWCDAIIFHEDDLELGTCKTLKMITDEANRLTAEISRLRAENERLQNLIGDRDAEIATAFEQGRIFGNGEVEDKIQTAEQRVAGECVVEVDNEPEYPDDAPPKLCQILTKAMDERDLDLLLHAMRQTVRLTKECIGERIKAKYHLEYE